MVPVVAPHLADVSFALGSLRTEYKEYTFSTTPAKSLICRQQLPCLLVERDIASLTPLCKGQPHSRHLNDPNPAEKPTSPELLRMERKVLIRS